MKTNFQQRDNHVFFRHTAQKNTTHRSTDETKSVLIRQTTNTTGKQKELGKNSFINICKTAKDNKYSSTTIQNIKF